MNLDDIKLYLRIDGSEEDFFLTSLISASKIYLKNATGIDVDETNDLHNLAVSLLVSNSYENRLPIGQGNNLSFSLESIIYQMRYCYESGTV
jgi:uncharacterized phage protein (predicted DNA packaging)